MKMKHQNVTRSLVLSSVVGAMVACGGGGGSSSSSSASVDQAYAGPGSKWDVTLNTDNSFSISRRDSVDTAVTLTVEGTYERLTSGFVKLTVGSSVGDDGPSQGDTAWALEAPGYAFFLNPIQDGSSQMIAMVTSGACPSSSLSANWVLVKKASDSSASSTDSDFFGTFAFNDSTGVASLPEKRSLADTSTNQGPEANIGSGSCSDGIMTIGSGADGGVMYLTANGGAIVHTNVDDEEDASFIFALPQTSITAVANLDGDFSGLLFDDSQSSGDEISPVAFSCASGTCTGNIVTNIDTGELSVDEVTISLNGTPDAIDDGLITATITSGSDTGVLACMADTDVLDSGSVMVSCVGQSPGDNAKMFNVMLVSKS
ncbi:hypothetical protein A9Q99_20575 [Gammaproteobacteria bacterium 45_16_T64]|nr:hypothetical protein A9Q99_20575 [Gammaproteobacteria bacterium 45_16_T64]